MKAVNRGGRPQKVSVEEKKLIVQFYLADSNLPTHEALSKHGIFRDLAAYGNEKLREEAGNGRKVLCYYDFSQDEEVRSFIDSLVAASQNDAKQQTVGEYPAFPEMDQLLGSKDDELRSHLERLGQQYNDLLRELTTIREKYEILRKANYSSTQLQIELKTERDNNNALRQECASLKKRLKKTQDDFMALKRDTKVQRKQDVIAQSKRDDYAPLDPKAPLFPALEELDAEQAGEGHIETIEELRRKLLDDN